MIILVIEYEWGHGRFYVYINAGSRCEPDRRRVNRDGENINCIIDLYSLFYNHLHYTNQNLLVTSQIITQHSRTISGLTRYAYNRPARQYNLNYKFPIIILIQSMSNIIYNSLPQEKEKYRMPYNSFN